MGILQAIYGFINAVVGWVWGIPILILLVGGGIVLTFVIGGAQFRHFGFIMKTRLARCLTRKSRSARKPQAYRRFRR